MRIMSALARPKYHQRKRGLTRTKEDDMTLSSEWNEKLSIMGTYIATGDAYIYWSASKGHRSEGLDRIHSHRHHQFNS